MDPDKPKKIKLDPLITRDLWSGDEQIVLKAIHRLRSTGNIHYIPELLRLLNDSGREQIEKELVMFLADIKDPAARPFIIAALKNTEMQNARGNIVSVCWQSGLDYSADLDLFITLFLEGDYSTALECFTVIEEWIINLGNGNTTSLRDQLLGGIDKLGDDKKPLAVELVNLLEA